MSNKAICSAQRRINVCSNTDKSSRNSKLQVIFFSIQRNNLCSDECANRTSLSFVYQTRSNFDFVTNLEYSLNFKLLRIRKRKEKKRKDSQYLKDTSTSNTSLKVLDLAARLVDIERTDNDQTRRSSKISKRNRNLWRKMK